MADNIKKGSSKSDTSIDSESDVNDILSLLKYCKFLY